MTLAADIAKAYKLQQQAEKAARGKAHDEFEAAGGYKLTPEQLRGFLLPMRDHTDKDLAAAEARGRADIAREEAEKAKPKAVVEIYFPFDERGKRDGGRLKKEMQGLTWSRLRNAWEGMMNADDARDLAKRLGGTVRVEGGEPLPLAAE